MATQIKRNIEFKEDGTRTGWKVQLMSLGQGNIGSNLEYRFFMDLLSGNLDRKLFKLLIDQYNCPNLKSEMEVTQTKIANGPSSNNQVVKQKTGDKLPLERLAKESTNLTDALKYITMKKNNIKTWERGRKASEASSLAPK